jgi:hypothetical protein
VPVPDLFAYGPAPGLEFLPYLLGLVAWLGLSVLAILLSPFSALLRRLRRGRAPAEPKDAPAPETPEDGSQER